MEIKQVNNGYIVVVNFNTEVYKTLDEVFSRMLLHFENRSEKSSKEYYGKVVILREKKSEWVTLKDKLPEVGDSIIITTTDFNDFDFGIIQSEPVLTYDNKVWSLISDKHNILLNETSKWRKK